MVAVIVGVWAMNELSFDDFHRDGNRIYRLNLYLTLNNQPSKSAATFRPLGAAAKEQLPQIEDLVRVYPYSRDMRIGENFYPAQDYYIVDANFFTFFNFPL